MSSLKRRTQAWASSFGYGFTVLVAAFSGVALLGGSAAIADHENIDPQVCLEQFQREQAKCMTLTGFARAQCLQQAANHFRTCRGQASPTSPGPMALASIAGPEPVVAPPSPPSKASRLAGIQTLSDLQAAGLVDQTQANSRRTGSTRTKNRTSYSLGR